MEYEIEKPSLGKSQTVISNRLSSNDVTVPVPMIEGGLQDASTKPIGPKDFDIEFVHGVSEEDRQLSRRDKNAVDFAFNYSKVWCKACKDIVMALEKCAYAENEAYRTIVKQFQALEASVMLINGAPMKQQTLNLSRTMIDNYKDLETHNTKRHRELLEVLNRQRVLFEKTRKHLKQKWKADVKRLIDAENSLIKTKTAYYQRCQTGVKLREELAAAQNVLDELNSALASVSGLTFQPSGACSPTPGITNFPTGSASVGSISTTGASPYSGSAASIAQDGSEGSTTETTTTPTGPSTSSNQIAKQKSKVDRLEKQLSDNDKKEFEQTYYYREAVELANTRLYDLEKSKIEILCDTRLTILRSDEVVKDSLAELFHNLHTNRITMVNQYEVLATAFQGYLPCSDYHAVVQEHIQKNVDYYPEKYQFIGFHESTTSKHEALPGRLLVRVRVPSKEMNDGDGLAVHSESESDEETLPETGGGSALLGKSTSSSNVLSSIVEFGSNLFRPDGKKSVRTRKALSGNATQLGKPGTMASASAAEALDGLAAQVSNLEKECSAASFLIARCMAAIERQQGGLETQGIYRVPASKSKVSNLMEILQTNHPESVGQLEDELISLSQEQPLTLAGAVKTRLIALPEPLLTYNMYPKFVELGKTFESSDCSATKELIRHLQSLIRHLTPANRRLAGLLFHHLFRVSSYQKDNQMSSLNLGTMFAPTVLRQKPKFQVANMMEFVDNKGQTRVVEALINQAADIFGPSELFDPMVVIGALMNADESSGLEECTIEGLTGQRKGSDTAISGGLIKIHDDALSTASPIMRTGGVGAAPLSTGQHGLLRSATISAVSPGRSSALFGNPLPLYSPYRGSQSPPRERLHPGKDLTSEPSTTAGQTNVPLVQLAERSQLQVSNAVPDTIQLTSLNVLDSTKETHSAKAVSNAGLSSHGSLLAKNFKRHVFYGISSHHPVNTFSGSSAVTETPSGYTTRQLPVGDRDHVPLTSGSSTLTNLVVGRRRITSKQPVTEAHVADSPDSSSKTEKGAFLNSDQYTFIDTDTPEPTSP